MGRPQDDPLMIIRGLCMMILACSMMSPLLLRAPRLQAKKKRAVRAPSSTPTRAKSRPVIPSRVRTHPVLPGSGKHSRLPVRLYDRPAKT